IKKYPKINLVIEEHTTDEIINRLQKGQLDAAIAATPLNEAELKEIVLYYEPFVGYFPEKYRNNLTELTPDDLNLNDILLLQDGHCFTNGILNICKASKLEPSRRFELTSGSFEALIAVAKEGMRVTVLPYLHTLKLSENDKKHLSEFQNPKPPREISLICPKGERTTQIIDALKSTI